MFVANIPGTVKSYLFKTLEEAECFRKSISLLFPINKESQEIEVFDTKNPFDWDEMVGSANFKIFFNENKEEVEGLI